MEEYEKKSKEGERKSKERTDVEKKFWIAVLVGWEKDVDQEKMWIRKRCGSGKDVDQEKMWIRKRCGSGKRFGPKGKIYPRKMKIPWNKYNFSFGFSFRS
ncbi:hypothetical protein MSSIH_0817 [Methanosarcina siciliae HI350]|uniref:Uncharacterized protein n=1 Tax=Methanosarcina siciliae HI350 TaxID=1434119 RepID=A0A0E3PBF1_9EURY|nr:hypothetical protein [Methanosarcina siciliae]AKB31507.1 hypothetical protein MSSIH_0817 [Methanosarcina siciliae HI350]